MSGLPTGIVRQRVKRFKSMTDHAIFPMNDVATTFVANSVSGRITAKGIEVFKGESSGWNAPIESTIMLDITTTIQSE